MKTKKLNWNPRKRGNAYCSSACGAGCKYTDYLAAKRIGGFIRQMMKQPSDWTVTVWENLGWHWKLKHTNGYLSLWGDSHGATVPTKFHAMLSTDAEAMGCNTTWYDDKRHTNPNKAVEHRLKLAANVMDGINRLLFKFNFLHLK